MDPTPNTTKKPIIGKTGVHLRYYKTGEYRNLTNEQKEELKEWRANNPNTFKAESKKAKKENPKKSKQSMKKQVTSLVTAAYGSFNRDIFNILDLLWVSHTLFIHIFTIFMYKK